MFNTKQHDYAAKFPELILRFEAEFLTTFAVLVGLAINKQQQRY